MAKPKNKRKAGLAEKKRKPAEKKLNPFEVHCNREKTQVLGKKLKNDRGMPGISRGKAIKKRKETLGVEMKVLHKTNMIMDRRIGIKKGASSVAEDQMTARFAIERARQAKKQMFNLADETSIVLTHRGQTLEQIEKFDDPISSDDEDPRDKLGKLDGDIVSSHFGGGLLSHGSGGGTKDVLAKLITESKKRKEERMMEKEETINLTSKVDDAWKDLKMLTMKRQREEEESAIDKVLKHADKNTDYDMLRRAMIFERKGTPSEPLKSDAKKALEEKEKLDLLEKERRQRMEAEELEGVREVPRVEGKHRSADDLDDNFELEDAQDFMLAYDKDGNPLVPEHIFRANHVPNSKPKYEDGVSDTSSGEDEDDDENDEQTDNDSNAEKDDKMEDTNVDEDGTVDEDEIHNAKENVKVEDKADTEKANENNKTNEGKKDKNRSKTEEFNSSIKDAESGSEDEEDEEESENEQADAEMNEKDNFNDLRESDGESDEEMRAEDEVRITSFFDPQTEGDNLNELLRGKTPSQQSAALQKLIKSYDPGLSENNKDLLSRLFARMLQYVNDTFTELKEEADVIKAFLIFDKIAPHFYDLAHTVKVSTKKFIVDLLKEKHDIYQKNKKRIPDLDTLIFFKLVSLLYPTSDFRHPVTTPSLYFMMDILRLCKFDDAYSISRGFFVASLILEYTVLSKRYEPTVVNFIRGILYLTSDTTILNPVQVVPPFKLHHPKILKLEEDRSNLNLEHKMAAKDLVLDAIDDSFKIRCLVTSVLMLKELFENYNELEAQEAVFKPHLDIVARIELDMCPGKVSKLVRETVKHIKECLEVKTYTPLSKERKRPRALRMYEPDVEEVFTGSKCPKLNRDEAERRKLQHKYKKEMKGALREIRRDNAYVASVKIRDRIREDNIRKEKVKNIFKDASVQQGELNKLKRMK